MTSSGASSVRYGGLVGELTNSTISGSSASGSVTSSGASSVRYGGLVGELTNSTISGSSAGGSVTSNEDNNDFYGGLAGVIQNNSAISYTSASGNVISNGENHAYGGLAGLMDNNSTISYSSASGNVISSGANGDDYGDDYGGLVGESFGAVQHSWSSSSVFASNPAGLVGNNTGNLKFSYALGDASYGLVATNTGTIKNSYWNSETSGALLAAKTIGTLVTNIASSDTAGMLTSTGSAEAMIFKGFFDATDELNRNIWSFASGNYPVIAALGVDKQAVSLAYGLLRLARPTTSDGLASFLGATLNNEDIELIANSYNADDTLAILDVNLLQSNSATCVAGSTDIIMTTTGANQAMVTLSINVAKTSSDLHRYIVYQDCNIVFYSGTFIQTGDRLQLDAIITKGSASLIKKFVINFL